MGKRGEYSECSIKGELCVQRLQDKKKHVRFGTEGKPVWLERLQSTLELWNKMRLNRSFELKNELLAKVAASIAACFAMQWLTAMNAHFPHVWGGAQLGLAALF